MDIIKSAAGHNSLHKVYSKKTEVQQKDSSKKESEDILFEKSSSNHESNVKGDYSHLKAVKYTVNKSEIEAMKNELDERMKDTFLQMVKESIGDQNQGYKYAIEKALKEGTDEIKPEMIEQAKQDVGEGGYWSVENTVDRILKFAKALSGEDPEKAEMLKEAFLKGYEEAEKAWGGGLPEISQKTKEAVLEGFDNWIGENKK